MVTLEKLKRLYQNMKIADRQNLHRDYVAGGDGLINLNVFHGRGDALDFVELNSEFLSAQDIVNDLLSINRSNLVTFHILNFLDELDGVRDGIIHLDVLKQFIEDIQSEPVNVSELIMYLIDIKEKKEWDLTSAPLPVQQTINQNVHDLSKAIDEFKELLAVYNK